MKNQPVKCIIYILPIVLVFYQCRPKQEDKTLQFPGKPIVPELLLNEHDTLLHDLKTISVHQDSTGRIAAELYDLLDHHFQEEENYVLPPLGLLTSLSGDSLPENTTAILRMIDKLKAQTPHMSAEHQMIKLLANDLLSTAKEEGHAEVENFYTDLLKHAQMEEKILFPTALLIGEYLRIKAK